MNKFSKNKKLKSKRVYISDSVDLGHENIKPITSPSSKIVKKKSGNKLNLLLALLIGICLSLLPSFLIIEEYKKDLKIKDKNLSELQQQLNSISVTLKDQEAIISQRNNEIDSLNKKIRTYIEPFSVKDLELSTVTDIVPKLTSNSYNVTTTNIELNCSDEQKVFLNNLNTYAMLSDSPLDGRQDLSSPLLVNGIPIVSKFHWLNQDYAPGINSEAENAFLKMKDDAAKEGIELVAFSIYRSYGDQKIVNENWLKENSEAYRSSSMAGQSEHQTGLAFDINDRADSFAPSASTEWLANNAYKYGFILRYPKDKEHITGYIYEPWHYRYVGQKISKDFGPRSNLTLEEYFGLINQDMLDKITPELSKELDNMLKEKIKNISNIS